MTKDFYLKKIFLVKIIYFFCTAKLQQSGKNPVKNAIF